MAGDLSHFLLPNSRLPKDVYFSVGGVEIAAHKSLLASKHHIFDQMFYEDEAGSALNTVKVEVDVSEGTFTLFLRYLYGSKMDEEEVAELEALVEIHSLACQFDQRALRKEVVGKLRNLLTKESRGLCEVVELRNLLLKHKVEELVPLVKESQVEAEDLEGLLAIASRGGSQSKVAEEMVIRYLGTSCPTTRELAAFAASTSKELLPDEMLASIIKGIHGVSRGEVVEKDVVETGAEEEVEEKKVEGREILRSFLEFTKFPEKYRDPMIEKFFEEAM